MTSPGPVKGKSEPPAGVGAGAETPLTQLAGMAQLISGVLTAGLGAGASVVVGTVVVGVLVLGVVVVVVVLVDGGDVAVAVVVAVLVELVELDGDATLSLDELEAAGAAGAPDELLEVALGGIEPGASPATATDVVTVIAKTLPTNVATSIRLIFTGVSPSKNYPSPAVSDSGTLLFQSAPHSFQSTRLHSRTRTRIRRFRGERALYACPPRNPA